MERTMLVMIAAVALVAIGGLLFVGVQKAPEIIPVFLEQPVIKTQEIAPGTVLGQATGQITFKMSPESDSTPEENKTTTEETQTTPEESKAATS